MVEKIYPAIIKSDILVMICPNYNDSISANLMAFVNRLTAVFRANDFGKKRVYAIIVSGYSGGDIVAQQIIGAISMNKNFILPEEFAMIETANHAGDIMLIDKIEEKAERFAIKMV
jgi:multimeric flavodoxin WrbA